MHPDEVTSICLTRWPERAAMLFDALHFWCLQTHPHRKLVLVNDGAPLRSLDPRVRVVNLTGTKTIGEKRNIGIENTTSPWASTLDDDDAALPEHLAALLATGEPWIRSARAWLSDAALRVVGITADTLHCTTLVRTDAVRRAGGYPAVDYAEDAALATRLRHVLGTPKPDPRAELITYVHRRHRANVSAGHSTAGLDRDAARGAAALSWWTDPEFAAATARIAALRAAPVPGPWPLVAPIDGRAVPPAPRVEPRPVLRPFVVDGVVDATGVSAPCLDAVVRAAREAGCLRRIAVIRQGDGTRASALRMAMYGLAGQPPGAVAWIDARACGLRRDHICKLAEATRAGGVAISRGTPDAGEVGNKVSPWLPWSWPAAMAVCWPTLQSVPESLWTDDALPAALVERARHAGGRVETMTLDGVTVPSASAPIVERIRRVVDAVRAARG